MWVGPANVKGIEKNAYAAELARVSVWIGEIQWMRRNGYTGADDPILNLVATNSIRGGRNRAMLDRIVKRRSTLSLPFNLDLR